MQPPNQAFFGRPRPLPVPAAVDVAFDAAAFVFAAALLAVFFSPSAFVGRPFGFPLGAAFAFFSLSGLAGRPLPRFTAGSSSPASSPASAAPRFVPFLAAGGEVPVDVALAAEAGAALGFGVNFLAGGAIGEVGASSETGSIAGAGVFALEPLVDIWDGRLGAAALGGAFGLPAFLVEDADVAEFGATGSFAGAVVDAWAASISGGGAETEVVAGSGVFDARLCGDNASGRRFSGLSMRTARLCACREGALHFDNW